MRGNSRTVGGSSQSGLVSSNRNTRSAPAIAVNAWLNCWPMGWTELKNMFARKKN